MVAWASVVPVEVVKVTLWICFEGRAIGSAYCLLPRNIASDLLYPKHVSSLRTSGDKFALKYPLPDCELKNIVSGLGSIGVRLWQGWPTGTPKTIRIPSELETYESSKTS